MRSTNLLDFTLHKQEFHGFWNSDFLTSGQLKNPAKRKNLYVELYKMQHFERVRTVHDDDQLLTGYNKNVSFLVAFNRGVKYSPVLLRRTTDQILWP